MPTAKEQRFIALYEDTKARIAAYVVRRTSSREDAADVVAETYAVAWRRIEAVPQGHDGLLWLYVTARQLLANRSRRLRRDDALICRLSDELVRLGDTFGPRDDEALAALASLRALPAEQREILMLAAWEGLGAGEIGRVLGCSPTAARIRLHRARTRLRDEVRAAPGPPKQQAATRHVGDRDAKFGCVPEEAKR